MATALITGASSGIGAVFADRLAAEGNHLVLVARSQDKLTAIAQDLSQRYGIKADVIAQDLVEPDAATQVFTTASDRGHTIDMLINNAGFGLHGAFTTRDRQTQLDMIQLNVTALVDLTYQFLPGMQARQQGSIINVASTAAFQAIPYFAVYAATKAFVLSFSEALWHECSHDGVKVLALCPGPTETEFFKVADFPSTMENQMGQNYASPEAVVEDALKALARGHSNVVTGGVMNQVLVNASRLFPREMLVNSVGRFFKG